MKTAIALALAALLTGCLTEPGETIVTDCRGIPTYERPGDSAVVMEQYCGGAK